MSNSLEKVCAGLWGKSQSWMDNPKFHHKWNRRRCDVEEINDGNHRKYCKTHQVFLSFDNFEIIN